jgi:hypothetical protein
VARLDPLQEPFLQSAVDQQLLTLQEAWELEAWEQTAQMLGAQITLVPDHLEPAVTRLHLLALEASGPM